MEKYLNSIRDHLENRIASIAPYSAYFDGFEEWFQIEVIVALRGKATVWGKKEKDADIVVDDQGIELKASKTGGSDVFTPAFRDHKDADYYLFLHQHSYPIKYKSRLIESMQIVSDWYLTLMK